MPDETAPIPSKPVPPFEVIAAPGDAREAAEIARAIASTPGPLWKTGVLMRAPARQATKLDVALGDAGIPHHLPGES